ncbi:MAG: cell division protein FtsZ [Anaerolineales bacterium]|nr:cell division protein FtsZ [Chloroflexota bacterium]MBL6982339.1 cell division protein FtsZ [Anaerolineales bacterium]
MNSNPHTAPTKPTRISTPVHQPVIKVLGLGGGGSNAVDRMLELELRGVDFIVANTDQQALNNSNAGTKLQLGPKLTRGLGAGGRPSVGEDAAIESREELAAALQGADMVFLAAGMGGGTGTGSIPIAAEIAKSLEIVTIAVVTTPFSFEMGRRQLNAMEGLNKLQAHANTLITIPNDRLLYASPKDLPIDTAFRLADDVLRQAVQSITELITEPGLINVDFAHIRRMMHLGGGALMAIGHGKGENKALKAIQQALDHPLLETVSLHRAAGIIANFTASDELSLMEIGDALLFLQDQANPDSEVVFGTTPKSHMGDRVQVNLVVTGLGAPTLEEVLQGVEKQQPVSTSFHSYTPAPIERAHISQVTHPVPSITSSDLDIPAFLRRQSRVINN